MQIIEITKFRGLGDNYNSNFSCSRLGITSLIGSPKNEVTGNFTCFLNNLKTLKGSPKIIGGNFNRSSNEIETLLGSPEIVNGSFNCEKNKLESLIGSPNYVGVNFMVSNNHLKSLEGRPKYIGGNFYCGNNQNLKNFKEQIIKYQIRAKKYITDREIFEFEDIKEEFERYVKKEEIKKLNKNKIQNTDFGLSI